MCVCFLCVDLNVYVCVFVLRLLLCACVCFLCVWGIYVYGQVLMLTAYVRALDVCIPVLFLFMFMSTFCVVFMYVWLFLCGLFLNV